MGWKDYPIYEMEVIKSPWFQTTNEYFHGISMGYIYISGWWYVLPRQYVLPSICLRQGHRAKVRGELSGCKTPRLVDF